MDRTSKLLLALVALGLFANALRPEAHAADTVPCRVEGPIDIRITSIQDDIEVEWGFSQPGSSSSSPMYVKTTN